MQFFDESNYHSRSIQIVIESHVITVTINCINFHDNQNTNLKLLIAIDIWFPILEKCLNTLTIFCN